MIVSRDNNKYNVVVEPFNDATLNKIEKLLSLYLRTSEFEPTERDLSVFTFRVSDKKVLLSGDQCALARPINILSCNAFMRMKTSRQIINRLEALHALEPKLASENIPLLTRMPAGSK